MGIRSFTDSQGRAWQAWDIVPRLAERRGCDRRHVRIAVDRDRRRVEERRLLRTERTPLSHGMHQGWLCFGSTMEKRRLAPVPPDWLRCTLDRLETYLGAAIPASPPPDVPLQDRRTG